MTNETISTGTDLGDPQYIVDRPTSLRLLYRATVTGRFVRLERSDYDPSYGKPWIAVFTDCEGMHQFNGDAVILDPDAEYGLWLIHTMARVGLKELRPEVGERIAIRYDGRKASRTRKDSRGNPVEYHAYRFAAPDRPTEPAQEVSWDTMDDEEAED